MISRRISMVVTFFREVFSAQTLRREPESSLIMEDLEEVEAYAAAGASQSGILATYIFNAAQATQALHGCRRVLDLGCGPAHQLAMTAELNPGTQFVGMDLSENMLAVARENLGRKGLANVTLVKGDITDLAIFSDGEFDGVMSTYALHHLPTKALFLKCFSEIRRVLAKPGSLFIMDLGRLKSLQSVMFFAYRDAAKVPYLFALDFERSLRAAFRLEDFREARDQCLVPHANLYSTFKVPLMVILKTPERPLGGDVVEKLRRWRTELPAIARTDLDDMRFFFSMGGMGTDVFSGGAGEYGRDAYRRMAAFLERPGIKQIAFHFAGRLGELLRILLHVARHRMVRRLPGVDAHAQDLRLGKYLAQRLGRLKGPLMKVGQMLSYLFVDMPDAMKADLAELQDTTPPLSGEVVRKIVERELGKPISELFSLWRDIPIASASISQVHWAALPDGTPVAVKVRYPHIDEVVAVDLQLLKLFLPLVSRTIANARQWLEELRSLIKSECDFVQAAAFQEEFRRLYLHDAEVVIPKVFTQYSNREIITMEYIEGERYAEFVAGATQAQKNKAAEIIWRMAASSINQHSIYNADPHPGNYLFLKDKVCFLDFGFTRRFSREFMELWKEQSLAGLDNDLARFAAVNRKLGFDPDGKFDHAGLLAIYRRVIYGSWMQDRPFRFTKEFVAEEFRALYDFHRRQRGPIPVEFISTFRLLAGQHAILAELGAEGNWHRIVFPLLDKGGGAPPPEMVK